MVWYLAMAAVEDDEDVQKKGVVEVFFANDALGKRNGITEHLTMGLSALLCLPIRFVGIHFCYDSAIFKPIVQLAQMAFGAGNRLRFRSHFGTSCRISLEDPSTDFGNLMGTDCVNRFGHGNPIRAVIIWHCNSDGTI
jgi:hypothetical protein